MALCRFRLYYSLGFSSRFVRILARASRNFALKEVPGGCTVSIDIAGPSKDQSAVLMVPDLNRWASDWIIDQCVAGGRAVGGFHTRAFKNVIDIVTKPGMNPGDPLRKFYSAHPWLISSSLTYDN